MVMQFFPAWCYALPMTLLDIPLALWEAVLWTAIPYFAVGYYKDAGRSAISLSAVNCYSAVLSCFIFKSLHHLSSVLQRPKFILYTCLDKIGVCMVTAEWTAFWTGMVMHIGCHDLGISPCMSVCTQAHIDSLSLLGAMSFENLLLNADHEVPCDPIGVATGPRCSPRLWYG